MAWVTGITAAVSLVCIEYLGKSPGYSLLINWLNSLGLEHWASDLYRWLTEGRNPQLHRLQYWAIIAYIFYVLVPVVVIRFVLKKSLRDFGLSTREIKGEFRLFFLFAAIMIPLVILVSFTKGFQDKYPFYQPALGESLFPDFWTWEIMYLLQFVALEFFFRGFMVHGTKRVLGSYAVLFMVIPYCMIHFGKPMAENFGAIAAGVVLGFVSLRYNSIWLGVIIHYTVALTMDLASLWQKGFF
jgi:uncharacterized protein